MLGELYVRKIATSSILFKPILILKQNLEILRVLEVLDLESRTGFSRVADVSVAKYTYVAIYVYATFGLIND